MLEIDGETIELDATKCYIPIFRHKISGSNQIWYMGNIVNEKYYMVFDMSPYDEKNMDFLQMGFGVVNSRGIVLE